MKGQDVRHDSIVIEGMETVDEFEELGFLEQSDMVKELTGIDTAAVSGYSLDFVERDTPIMEIDYVYLAEKPQSSF